MSATMPRFLTVIFALAMLLPAGVHAQGAPELVLPEQADVRIIVDISGSMKKNDPDNLRQPAVRLLARMLPEGATAGLWTFGQYVNMLVPHREVTDQWRELAQERSGQINSVALRTNLGKAIEVAGDGYYTGGVLENTHFIVLTDGRVDISDEDTRNREEENRVLKSIAPGLAAQGATFHPIALSAEADADFLRQLAQVSGGRFQVAETAEALSRAFLEALNTAVPQEQIPIEGDGFTVDEGVSEFTALVFWGEQETRETRKLELVSPEGKRVGLESLPANVRWTREAGYDLMTINEPKAGRWQLDGELGEGSRVTVVSDLRMAVGPIPSSFSEQTPIDLSIAFYEDGEQITDQDFLQVLDVRVSVVSEDGRSGTKSLSDEGAPADGVFSDTISRLPADGLYRIDVVADGQTFGRKFSATTSFESPVPDVDAGELSALGEEIIEPDVATGQSPADLAPGISDESAHDAQASSQGTSQSDTQPEAIAENQAEAAADGALQEDITSPIDIGEVETAVTAQSEEAAVPAAEPTEALAEQDDSESQESATSMPPMWMLGAGAGGLALIVLTWLALKWRKNKKAEQTETDESSAGKTDAGAEEPDTPLEPQEDQDHESEEGQLSEEDQEPETEVDSIPELEEPEAPVEEDMPEVTDELTSEAESAQGQPEVKDVPANDIP
ncbi:MAG: VWA domain-containing protein, partial [Pseudomonadota bacterium]|nr:VWA domain-containing protein [Pseudomonadota bacterium]